MGSALPADRLIKHKKNMIIHIRYSHLYILYIQYRKKTYSIYKYRERVIVSPLKYEKTGKMLRFSFSPFHIGIPKPLYL